MIRRDKPMPDGFFRTSEVVKLTGATVRQLQWWDDTGLLPVRVVGHMRLYARPDVELVRVVRALRRKGLTIPQIRKGFIRAEFLRLAATGAVWIVATPRKFRYACSESDAVKVMELLREPAALVVWRHPRRAV